MDVIGLTELEEEATFEVMVSTAREVVVLDVECVVEVLVMSFTVDVVTATA